MKTQKMQQKLPTESKTEKIYIAAICFLNPAVHGREAMGNTLKQFLMHAWHVSALLIFLVN